MGRHQTVVSGWAGGPGDGEGWSKAYKLEWGEVIGHRVRRLRQARDWKLHDLQHLLVKVVDEMGLTPEEAIARLARFQSPS